MRRASRLFAILFTILSAVQALPALAHPGHGAPEGHAWHQHSEFPLAIFVTILAVLAWGGLRRRQGVLPLAIALALALGAGGAGVGLPL